MRSSLLSDYFFTHIIPPLSFFENKKGSTPAFYAWQYCLLITTSHFLFAGIPAVSAAPLHYGMMLLAANLSRGKHIGLCFYSSPALNRPVHCLSICIITLLSSTCKPL